MENIERNARPTRIGYVVGSGAMNKTVKVAIVENKKHPVIGKVVKQTKVYKAHDENNECGIGDRVEIMETRPLSKEKYHRVVRIIEKAK